jgi:hypothetical protein
MDADLSVELGADDEALEFPWTSLNGELRYYDIRNQPDLLLYISEANHYQELGEFLEVVNSPNSVFLTAKCDVWFEDELQEAEEIYGAKLKLGSYVDFLFVDPAASGPRFDFPRHEKIADRLVQLLGRVPQISVAVEFIIRRCYYHLAEDPVCPGFYVTFYCFGYGDDREEARKRWGIGMNLVQNAILQLSAEIRRGTA